MVTIDPDAPWLANLILIGVVLVVPAIVTYFAQKRNLDKHTTETRRAVSKTVEAVGAARSEIEVVREEVQNSHKVNLRVDLDKVIQASSNLAADMELVRLAVDRIERFQDDLNETQRALAKSLDRKHRQQTADLADAVKDREQAITALSTELRAQLPSYIDARIDRKLHRRPDDEGSRFSKLADPGDKAPTPRRDRPQE